MSVKFRLSSSRVLSLWASISSKKNSLLIIEYGNTLLFDDRMELLHVYVFYTFGSLGCSFWVCAQQDELNTHKVVHIGFPLLGRCGQAWPGRCVWESRVVAQLIWCPAIWDLQSLGRIRNLLVSCVLGIKKMVSNVISCWRRWYHTSDLTFVLRTAETGQPIMNVGFVPVKNVSVGGETLHGSRLRWLWSL